MFDKKKQKLNSDIRSIQIIGYCKDCFKNRRNRITTQNKHLCLFSAPTQEHLEEDSNVSQESFRERSLNRKPATFHHQRDVLTDEVTLPVRD